MGVPIFATEGGSRSQTRSSAGTRRFARRRRLVALRSTRRPERLQVPMRLVPSGGRLDSEGRRIEHQRTEPAMATTTAPPTSDRTAATTSDRSRLPRAHTKRVRRWSPAVARACKETLYLLLDLPVGVVGFTLVITGLSLAAGLSITLLGIPLLAATLMLARVAGRGERARARALLDFKLQAPGTLPRARTPLARLLAPIRDASTSVPKARKAGSTA